MSNAAAALEVLAGADQRRAAARRQLTHVRDRDHTGRVGIVHYALRPFVHSRLRAGQISLHGFVKVGLGLTAVLTITVLSLIQLFWPL